MIMNIGAMVATQVATQTVLNSCATTRRIVSEQERRNREKKEKQKEVEPYEPVEKRKE